MHIELKSLCGGCPEDYDVIAEGECIGYLRLRHGTFKAMTQHCDMTIWETKEPKGDGIFENDERDGFLRKGITAILLYRAGVQTMDIADFLNISFSITGDS